MCDIGNLPLHQSGPRSAQEVVLSPTGDRLAWLRAESPSFDLFGKHSRSETVQPPRVFCIWVSAADGSSMREVGRTRLDRGKDQLRESGRYDHPWSLRWVPDGNHVSFRFGDGLFVVPAGAAG